MGLSKKYYYQGYECLATYQEKSGHWLCVVENVTYPFSFEASDERFIQGNFEHDINDYIQRCRDRGIEPKKESVLHNAHHDRHFAIASGMRNQEKVRVKKEKQQQRDFDRSYWRYAVAGVLTGVPIMAYLMMAWIGTVVSWSLFFPYHAQVENRRFPLLTVAVCLLCILVFVAQMISDRRFESDCRVFSQQKQFAEFFTVMRSAEGFNAIEACYQLDYISGLKAPEQYINKYAADMIADSANLRPYAVEELGLIILNAYNQQMKAVAPSLTRLLVFKSNQFDLIGAYTAKFAHADFEHILFNLIFFFAFAASVELLAGPLFFIAMFVVIPPLIAVFYSDSFLVSGNLHGNSSLGLSGMCSAFMACLLVLRPKLKIKTLFWFVVLFRSYSVPITFLSAWWISWDVVALMDNVQNGTNHIAHFVGTCAGAVAGWIGKFLQKHSLLPSEAHPESGPGMTDVNAEKSVA